MLLQIKYNVDDLSHALSLAAQTSAYADILEVGALLLLKEGVHAIEAFKTQFPDKKIYADAKIVDKGDKAVALLARAGADYISVLANAYHYTIRRAVEAAREHNVLTVFDLICSETPASSAADADALGVDMLLVHRALTPTASVSIMELWPDIQATTNLPIFIQGRIDPKTLPEIMMLKPAGVVVGSSIIEASNPTQQAAKIKELLS